MGLVGLGGLGVDGGFGVLGVFVFGFREVSRIYGFTA